MKTILYLVSLLCSLYSYSQLTVRNNAMIYATDDYIYVEDDVDLTEATSKLYLRNDAQLLQGPVITGNSGLGQLSVQQNGTVHEFAYNYWCSPVGNVDADDFINRSARVNLIDDSIGSISSNDALFTSSYEGISSPLTISTRWLYTFTTSTSYSDWNYVGASGDIPTGLGFTMKGTNGSGSNQLYDFRGKPNNGTISNLVTADNFTLVGNPYPSAIDTREVIWDANNRNTIEGTLYYWEQDLSVLSHHISNYAGGYATYTITEDGLTQTFTPATFDTYNEDGSFNTMGASSTTSKRARRYIPIGQGFMVKGQTGITGTNYFTLRNSHRTFYKQSDADSQFFRTNSNLESDNLDPSHKRFRLNIDFNDLYTRQLVQTFHDSATPGFDYGLESKHPEDVDSDAFWTIDNVAYVAEANAYDESLTLPLSFNLNEQTSLRIRILDVQNFSDAQAIYIHDIDNDIYVDLLQNNFEFILPLGVHTNKYEITFTSNTTLGLDDNLQLDKVSVFQNNDISQLSILNPNSLDLKHLKVFDVSGKQLIEQVLSNQNNFEISTKNLSDGVYLVKLSLKDKGIITKKIIVKN